MPIQAPKIGVFGDFVPLNVSIHHRRAKKAHPCVNPRLFKLYICDVYVGGKVRVSELMISLDLRLCGSK